MTTSNESDRTELLLRASRRGLLVVLGLVVLIAATIIAHVLRPGSLVADWASRAPWLLPVAIVCIFATLVAPVRRRFRADELNTMRNDEFRQVNLARAQRVALVAVLIAQIPLAILVARVGAVAAVTTMGVGTITVAIVTLITSFLYFERD